MENIYDKVLECAEHISKKLNNPIPSVAIMMGTGLSSITEIMDIEQSIPYGDVPYFPKSTVESHKGEIVLGRLGETPVLIMAGRWHYYEGYSTKEFTFPIRVLKHLGVEKIIFTNVSGGVNASYNAGDLVIIKDHINTIPDHPLRGHNDERLGPRFPDMLYTYDREMISTIEKSAHTAGIEIHKGVYYALQGPSLETPAEYAMIHHLGADMVGMSTVPEVIVAKHAGLAIAAISIISNVCFPIDRITETTIESVIAIANKSAKKLNAMLVDVVKNI